MKVKESKLIVSMFKVAAEAVCKAGLAGKGDLVVVTAGVPYRTDRQHQYAQS